MGCGPDCVCILKKRNHILKPVPVLASTSLHCCREHHFILPCTSANKCTLQSFICLAGCVSARRSALRCCVGCHNTAMRGYLSTLLGHNGTTSNQNGEWFMYGSVDGSWCVCLSVCLWAALRWRHIAKHHPCCSQPAMPCVGEEAETVVYEMLACSENIFISLFSCCILLT